MSSASIGAVGIVGLWRLTNLRIRTAIYQLVRPHTTVTAPTTHRRPPGPFRFERGIYIEAPSDRVWALIEDPAFASDVGINARGSRVSGTPTQDVGERRTFVEPSGETTTFEVIEIDPGRRYVTRKVDPVADPDIRYSYELKPVRSGVVFTIGIEVDAPPGAQRVRPVNLDLIHRWQTHRLDAVARAAITGNGAP